MMCLQDYVVEYNVASLLKPYLISCLLIDMNILINTNAARNYFSKLLHLTRRIFVEVRALNGLLLILILL
jgi:hypothetical protein